MRSRNCGISFKSWHYWEKVAKGPRWFNMKFILNSKRFEKPQKSSKLIILPRQYWGSVRWANYFITSFYGLYNNYSMSPSWIWCDKITNERVARVGYNPFISNKGQWNNCFSKFSNRILPKIFISTILQRVRKEKTWRTISIWRRTRLFNN